MARASSRTASTGDMVRSLVVIVVPVVLITWFFTRTPDAPEVATVEWAPVLATARAEADFPVLAPRAVPADWQATKVAWLPAGRPGLNGEPSPRDEWQLGFLDGQQTYLALVQGDAQLPQLVDQATRSGLPDGTSDVAGTTWRRTVSPDGRTRSLVLAGDGSTAVVSGDLPYTELESFAATLDSS